MLGYLVNWTMDDVDDQKGDMGGDKIRYAGSPLAHISVPGYKKSGLDFLWDDHDAVFMGNINVTLM